MTKVKKKNTKLICVDNKVFKLLKNKGQIVAEASQKESEIDLLTRKLEEVKNAEKNRQAVYDARGQLIKTLDKHGMAMKSWGKAYSYTVISALLVGQKNIKKLKCFTKKVE